MERPFTYLAESANEEDTRNLVRGFKDFSGMNNVRRFAVFPNGDIYATAWTTDRDNFDARGRVWFRITELHEDYNREFEFTGWYDVPAFIKKNYLKKSEPIKIER